MPLGEVTVLPLIVPEETMPPVEKMPVPNTKRLPETTVLTKTMFVKTPDTAEIKPACMVSPVITSPLTCWNLPEVLKTVLPVIVAPETLVVKVPT